MKFIYKPILVLALLCLFTFNALSHHVIGGEITWAHVSGDSYKVTLTLYRDCNAIYSNPGNVVVTNLSTGSTFDLVVSGPSSDDITPVCKNSCTRCTDPGCTQSRYGFQKLEYTGVVQLSKDTSCEWLLSWSQCCNNNVGNVDNSITYLESWMNLCASGLPNSSPKFTNQAKILYCVDQCLTYNPGAADYDSVSGKDRLSYRFVPVKQTNSKLATYSSGFTYNYPVKFSGYPDKDASWSNSCQGFHLDTATGTMKFKPTETSISRMSFVVEEYRADSTGKLRKISSIQRLVSMYVISCQSTTVPSVQAEQNLTEYTFCAGSEGIIPFTTSSKNASDTLSLSWNEQIKGAVFSATGAKFPTGNFKWTPSLNDIRNEPYQFVVSVSNNDCPYPSVVDMPIRVKVVGSVNPVTIKVDTLPGLRNYKFTPVTNDTGLNFIWNFGDGDTSTEVSPVHHFKADDNFNVKLTTTYPEGCNVASNYNLVVEQCKDNSAPSITPLAGGNTYFVCANSTLCIPLSATDPEANRDSVYLNWDNKLINAKMTQNNELGKASGAFCWTPDTSYVRKEPYTIRLSANDNYYPCFDKSYVDITVYVEPSINPVFTPVKSFTNDLTYFFSPAYAGYSSYKWDFGDGNTSTAIKPTHTYTANGDYTVSLKVSNGPGCMDSFSKVIYIRSCSFNDTPTISSDNDKYNYSICAGDSLCLSMTATDADSNDTLTLSWDNGISGAVFQSTSNKGFFCWKTDSSDAKSAPYSFTVTVKDSCKSSATATFNITVHSLPAADFKMNPLSGTAFEFIPLDTTMTGYYWDFGDSTSSDQMKPVHTYPDSQSATYTVWLYVEDSNGCKAEKYASHTITITVTSTNDQRKDAGWKVYPNPVQGNRLTIESTASSLNETVTIQLLDLNGRRVLETTSKERLTELQLPRGIKQGVYMLYIQGKDIFSTEVLVK